MSEATPQAWSGRSDDVLLPKLDADYWKPGKSIEAVFEGEVEMTMGKSYRLSLSIPIKIDGRDVTLVEVPESKGLRAAIEALSRNADGKTYEPWEGDRWMLVCYAVRKAKKAEFSDSPQFELKVLR